MASLPRVGALRWLGFLMGMCFLSAVRVQGVEVSTSQVETKRARWERLSPAEKSEFRERFEKLRGMPEAEREQLVDRAQRLAREVVEIEAAMGEEERAALDALEPRARAQELRRLVAGRARRAASRLRSRMTPEERQQMKAAAPAERTQILRAILGRELSEVPEHIASLGEELGLSARALSRIRRGAPQEQRTAIARLLRRRIEKQVSEQGLPAGFTEARWERLRSMGDGKFLRALQQIRRRHPELGVPQQRREARMRRSSALAERLRSLPNSDFLMLRHVIIRALREGRDVTAALERWFERR